MIAETSSLLKQIPFETLGGDTLLDRFDTKYLLAAPRVPVILEAAGESYGVVTYGGRSISRYRTSYYDTQDFVFYRDHWIGRLPRVKVRVRRYLDSDLSFLEVKWKTPRGRTFKIRERFYDDWTDAVCRLQNSPQAECFRSIPWEQLLEVVTIDYDRITLLSPDSKERVTIDLALQCRNGQSEIAYSDMAIVEVKQERLSRAGITDLLRRERIRERSFSKYCLCVAMLYPNHVKTHNFRQLIANIHQL